MYLQQLLSSARPLQPEVSLSVAAQAARADYCTSAPHPHVVPQPVCHVLRGRTLRGVAPCIRRRSSSRPFLQPALIVGQRGDCVTISVVPLLTCCCWLAAAGLLLLSCCCCLAVTALPLLPCRCFFAGHIILSPPRPAHRHGGVFWTTRGGGAAGKTRTLMAYGAGAAWVLGLDSFYTPKSH